jgi:branched-chain amino acid transport system substrate-binding protein
MRKWGRKRLARGAAALVLGLPAAVGMPATGHAADTKTITIGMDFALTGAEAEEATVELDGAQLAIEEANANHTVPGYDLRTIVLNDATATAAGYDPAQAATNARTLTQNSSVVAIVGPIDSGSAKAMLPILSQAGLAMVAGSTTSPDLTDPKFAPQMRQHGVTLVFFRTCGNEAFVQPGMVNFFFGQHNVRSAYIVDDGGAGGAGIADAFQAAAGKKGIKVLGRDTLDSKASDYSPILTRIKVLAPDLLEYGGISLAGIKLAKQAYDILPNTTLRADASGIYEGDFLTGAGFPAAEGWYATSAAPHIFDTPAGEAWQRRYIERWHKQPSDYALTTYDAAVVVIDAIARAEKSGQPLNRANVRAAIEATNIQTLQGPISFDKNGDLQHPVISIFQVTHNTEYPEADLRQFKYVGTTAP